MRKYKSALGGKGRTATTENTKLEGSDAKGKLNKKYEGEFTKKYLE